MSSNSDGKGFDWSAVNQEPGSVPGAGATRQAATTAETPPAGPTLMDLCTPVFGLCAMVPREQGAAQPSYQQFRGEVLRALQRIETEAGPAGIEREDAALASYALSLLIDEQVAESEWASRALWASEPLHLVLHQDAEGGINFFQRLEGLAERQAAVKEVYLVCLAFGFRGKYAELEPAQQAAQLSAIRQRIAQSLQRVPQEKLPVLFPEAYRAGTAPAARGAGYPRWWLFAGFGTLGACLLLWLVLFVYAGTISRSAEDTVRPVAARTAAPQGGR